MHLIMLNQPTTIRNCRICTIKSLLPVRIWYSAPENLKKLIKLVDL